MPAFRDRPIKSKLMLIILFTSGMVLFLSTSAFVVNDLLLYRRNMVADLFTLADLVGINSSAGLIFNDRRTAEENIVALRANQHILMANIFDADGQLFATYLKEGMHEGMPPVRQNIRDYYRGATIRDKHFFYNDYVEVFKSIVFRDKMIGTVYIRSDLTAFRERLYWAGAIVLGVMLASFLLAFALASSLQKLITAPIYQLLQTMNVVSTRKNYSIRQERPGNDELGELVDGFNAMLGQIEYRDKELAQANAEITDLNERLKAENLRMGAELEVTRRLQQMVLPKEEELQNIAGLDIAGFMEPATEVGGDYYDVLQYDGRTKISIGDVTGHGLESGVLMLMVQMAVRTLLANHVDDPHVFLGVLNRVVHDNVRRMGSDKNLTLALLDYQAGRLRLCGQHEEVLVIRQGGGVERVDTLELGFMVGVEADIRPFIAATEIELQPGEGVVLYTDGITEARNAERELYGIERLCAIVRQTWDQPAAAIKDAVIADVRGHIGDMELLDDITLLVLKQKAA